MVAGHRQHRDAQPVDEILCGTELAGPGALGDVTGKYRHVRLLARGKGEQGVDDCRLVGAEMGVGDVQQYAHGAAPAALSR